MNHSIGFGGLKRPLLRLLPAAIYTILMCLPLCVYAQQSHGSKFVFRFATLQLLEWRVRASVSVPTDHTIAIHIQSESKGIHRIRREMNYKVWIQTKTFLPQEIKFDLRDAEEVFQRAKQTFSGRANEYVIEYKGHVYDPEKSIYPTEIRDLASALLAVRAWVASRPQDQQIELAVTDFAFTARPRYFRVTVRIAGYDSKLSTPTGILPTIRLDGEAIRVNPDGTTIPDTKPARGTLWLSDDAELRPVQMQGHLGFEDPTFELESYVSATTPLPMPSSLPGAVCRAGSSVKPCIPAATAKGTPR